MWCLVLFVFAVVMITVTIFMYSLAPSGSPTPLMTPVPHQTVASRNFGVVTPSHGRPPQVRGFDDVTTEHYVTAYTGAGEPRIDELDDGGVGELLQRQQETTGRDRTEWFLSQGRSAQTQDMARMLYADDEDTVTHIPHLDNRDPFPPPQPTRGQ
jgi:hypothetical protein